MRKLTSILVVLIMLTMVTPAEEGMWLLSQLKHLKLKEKGFKISPSDIYNPNKPCIANAIVNLGGGTAEVVSENGLILTNHHVAFGAVQRASTKGTDYITNGFLAKNYTEEIEAPGYSASILQKMEDVTAKFRKYNKIKDHVKRQKAIRKAIKKITDKIEKKGKDISARVVSMFSGSQYILFVHKRFDDVRVVYVPPAAIGNYGGDIDNWMWPRHTGDFSFMRIYMAPDGTGRAFHKDNVPYKPAYWLKIAKDGLKPGDQTFIMGYPGRTTRYKTSASVAERFKHGYPASIKLFKEVIELLESYAKDSQIARAKVAGLHKGLNNAMKNYQGNVEGMERIKFLEGKLAYEKELTEFLASKPELNKKYGNVLKDIRAMYAGLDKTRDKERLMNIGIRLSGTLFSTASNAYLTAKEREKPKKERDPGFSEKRIKRGVKRLQYSYMSFYEPVDKALLTKNLKAALALPEGSKIKGLEEFFKKNGLTVEQFVEKAFKNTKLKDVKFAKSLYSKSSKALEAMNEPLINLAKALYTDIEMMKKSNEKFSARVVDLRKKYIASLKAWKGKVLAPDANSTIRFSCGEVAGYKPKDAVWYKPFTTIKGMLEKDTGKKPFNVPAGIKKLYAAKDFGRWADPAMKDVPIAFTHKVDSTGGNSGSPVLNAKGEMIGILFDGNYEAMTGDWKYDGAIQRTISVDIRYVLFVTEKLAKATNIMKELGL